ncbi:MAG: aspartate--tRNA(Asn) ligase [Candidatus Bathyarchaeota archaeon]|nr:MAG: aspartate--tRNA(Asn) ligase [Candidatus Bathyarchaeota archaeon]
MEIDQLGDWRRTHYTIEVKPDLNGKDVVVLGWIRDIRDLGGIRFVILEDREGTIQITVIRGKSSKEVVERADSLLTQYSIGVKGTVKKTKMTPRGIEIIPHEIRILGVAEHPLPLDVTGRTPAEIDTRLNARVLDLRRDESRAVFRVEHVALETMRTFLSENGFIEVHTPRIIASATEGGAALFSVDYFGQAAFLAQSPQLYKEQLVVGFEKVFEIGPFFRAEESHTRRHLSEFISVDIEEAFATSTDVMKVLEELVHRVCKAVAEKCHRDLEILKYKIVVPEIPFKRLSYDTILKELEKDGISIPWGEDIPTPAFRTLGETHPYFYFITDWPTKSKAFYINPRTDNPEVSEGFDLMWQWVELASGGTRIHSKNLLIKRLKEQGLQPKSFQFHLEAFNYGMPPHAGWAIGLERLLMMLTGKKNIRDVVLFPRDRSRLTP